MNYEKEGIDIIIGTTLPTLDLFIEYKNGSDAFYLFFLYLRQSRIQDTRQTYSKDTFMMKRAGRGKQRFYKAKNLLLELGIIKKITKKDSEGKIIGHYVGIQHKYRISSTVLENQTVVNPVGGKQETNAPVDNNINTPIEKYKSCKSKKNIFNPPTAEEVIEYFEVKGFDSALGKKAREYYDAGDWKDANGKQVKNRKQKMIANWFREENKKESKSEYEEFCELVYPNGYSMSEEGRKEAIKKRGSKKAKEFREKSEQESFKNLMET